jgi:hypothetical protein
VKKALLGFVLMFLGLSLLSAGTVFVYIEESCNGERGFFLKRTRDGLFDQLYESGHIIFDDMSDKGIANRYSGEDFAIPLAAARKGGADFLIALSIDSTVKKVSGEPKAPEKIDSHCRFLLLEVGTGRRLAQGEFVLNNDGQEATLDRDKLGLELGHEIAAALAGKL